MDEVNLLPRKPVPTMSLMDIHKDTDKGMTKVEFADVYPQFDNDLKRAKARTIFLKEDKTLEETARIVDAPKQTVIAWAYAGEWVEQKKLELDTLQKEERIAVAKTRLKHRARIVNEQLETSAKIRGKATEFLDDAMSAGQIKAVAEAVKSAADVEARALGIAEDGKVSGGADEASQGQEGKRPLVVVFQGNGGLPPIRVSRQDVIDV